MLEALKKNMQKQCGFTLIELLIVVAIIGILVAISIPIVSGQVERARVATDAANERAAKGAANTEYLTSGTFAGQPCESSLVYAYFDAQNGKWLASEAGIAKYGKCTTTHAHENNIIEGVWNPADQRLYLRWQGADNYCGGSGDAGADEISLMALEDSSAQEAGAQPQALAYEGATPGLCMVSSCSHANAPSLGNIIDGSSLNDMVCKDCGEWLKYTGEAS